MRYSVAVNRHVKGTNPALLVNILTNLTNLLSLARLWRQVIVCVSTNIHALTLSRSPALPLTKLNFALE